MATMLEGNTVTEKKVSHAFGLREELLGNDLHV